MKRSAAIEAESSGVSEDGNRQAPAGDRSPDARPTVTTLIAEYADPARLLELYYWSQEPGLLDVIRGIVALPAKPRALLQAFLGMTANLKLVHAAVDKFGQLALFSPQVGATLMAARQALEGDDGAD